MNRFGRGDPPLLRRFVADAALVVVDVVAAVDDAIVVVVLLEDPSSSALVSELDKLLFLLFLNGGTGFSFLLLPTITPKLSMHAGMDEDRDLRFTKLLLPLSSLLLLILLSLLSSLGQRLRSSR